MVNVADFFFNLNHGFISFFPCHSSKVFTGSHGPERPWQSAQVYHLPATGGHRRPPDPEFLLGVAPKKSPGKNAKRHWKKGSNPRVRGDEALKKTPQPSWNLNNNYILN